MRDDVNPAAVESTEEKRASRDEGNAREKEENPTTDGHAKFAPPANTTSGPWTPGSFAYRDNQFPRGRPIVH
jgi:hypothetical protein